MVEILTIVAAMLANTVVSVYIGTRIERWRVEKRKNTARGQLGVVESQVHAVE